MSGADMRTYRCDRCREEHIVDYGSRSGKGCRTRVDPTNDPNLRRLAASGGSRNQWPVAGFGGKVARCRGARTKNCAGL